MNENDSAPMPLVAARWMVSRREHATHSGGCGRCSGRMRIFFQKMMFHKPEVVDAEAVGQLHLLEGVAEETALILRLPRPRQLVLVEDAESHTGP
jgi:hypothetical protein